MKIVTIYLILYRMYEKVRRDMTKMNVQIVIFAFRNEWFHVAVVLEIKISLITVFNYIKTEVTLYNPRIDSFYYVDMWVQGQVWIQEWSLIFR